MNVTSDLRGFALVCDEQTKKILLIAADRIDAELSERYVALPLDADGEPIHIGDSIEIIGGEYGTVVAIELCEDGGWNVSMRPTGWDTPTLFAAESVRHHHPPTVEDVLFESLRHFGAVDERTPDVDEWLREQAKRLRLVGDAE